MRSWFRRHPNIAVIVLAALWIVQSITIAYNWAHGHWFLVAIGVALAAYLSGAIVRFWERT